MKQINGWKEKYFVEEELNNTPRRIEAFINEWESKHDFNFTVFPNSKNYNQMVILKNIDFASLCSHHLLPFRGTVDIGYIPTSNICGISKLARLVDKHASKPQIQEELTADILSDLIQQLQPLGAMVIIRAQHDCMCIRGVKKPDSQMITSAIHGVFERNEVRNEFMQLIK